jgi:hypothetical protein
MNKKFYNIKEETRNGYFFEAVGIDLFFWYSKSMTMLFCYSGKTTNRELVYRQKIILDRATFHYICKTVWLTNVERMNSN